MRSFLQWAAAGLISLGSLSQALAEEKPSPGERYSGMKISEALADLAVQLPTDEITDRAYAAAKTAVLDALGCAMAGYRSPGVDIVVKQTKLFGGKPQSTVWFHGGRVPSPEATFANSVQTHALDLDDVHLPSVTHITSVIVPVAFAEGEATGASGKDTLAAVVMGIEIAGRLGRAYNVRRAHGGFLPTTMAGGFGATAAAARLRGLDTDQATHAMGIWYAHCSGNRQALLDGTLTKRIQPGIAARAGVLAANLAERGLTGPNRIVGNQPAALLTIYGTDRKRNKPTMDEIMAPRDNFEVEEISYKRFASCGASHPMLEAVIALVLKHDLKMDDIAQIDLFGIRGGLVGVPWRKHENPHVLAQFCAPYEVASLIRNRRFGQAEITNERIARDKEVDALARSVRFANWNKWDGPKMETTRGFHGVRIKLKDGRALHKACNRDDALRPDLMPWKKIVEKFKYNAVVSGLVDEKQAAEIVSAVQRLDECKDVREFVDKYLVPVARNLPSPSGRGAGGEGQ